ncbi:MAG: DUF2177 family protein [Brucellaceae bacterium]|nr:DUF2177 family protein [Brucellaceae bacterium]
MPPGSGPLLLERPNIGAAAVFYLACAAGIVFFAVAPPCAPDPLRSRWVLTSCSACAPTPPDVTSYATLRSWPRSAMSVVDVL